MASRYLFLSSPYTTLSRPCTIRHRGIHVNFVHHRTTCCSPTPFAALSTLSNGRQPCRQNHLAMVLCRQQLPLPPGPWTIPFIGDTLRIMRSGLVDLSAERQQKYGPIHRTWLIGERNVFIADTASVRKILNGEHTIAEGQSSSLLQPKHHLFMASQLDQCAQRTTNTLLQSGATLTCLILILGSQESCHLCLHMCMKQPPAFFSNNPCFAYTVHVGVACSSSARMLCIACL